jgi:hypothetical protein
MINLSNNVEFRVKWAGPNTPYIEFDKDGIENRITLSKSDIKAVAKKLRDFMTFYKEDFSPERVNLTDEDDWRDETHD